MTSFEFTRTDSSHSTSASLSSHHHHHHHEETEAASSHLSTARAGRRPLRNATPYGRHSGDWLFGSVEVRKSIKKGVKKVIHGSVTVIVRLAAVDKKPSEKPHTDWQSLELETD
ncbi:hypothetical protein VPNG_06145 [Cytospora leucostoma]|uniref:Uncharacterized protein n=1 Tax=Cytospora leucostoma TaxID=1230097 RepID=A0A423WYP1_9PEZI|nr:hypothetical protein VPNG_06145 [Cytospora leucostoma]